jgi:hypothetical protein
MCEQRGMDKPSIRDLMEAAGISKSYACEILGTANTEPKAPSRPLAIRIYRETGWRHESIADLTDEQIAVLEELDPWQPRKVA